MSGAPPEDSTPLVADAVLGLRDGRKLLPCCEDCYAAKKKPLAYGKGLTSPWRRRRSARARWRSGRRARPNGAGAGVGGGGGAASCLTLRTRTRRWVVLTHHPRTPLCPALQQQRERRGQRRRRRVGQRLIAVSRRLELSNMLKCVSSSKKTDLNNIFSPRVHIVTVSRVFTP